MRGTRAALIGGAIVAMTPGRARAQAAPTAPETIPVGEWQLTPLVQVRARGEYRRDSPELGGESLSGVRGARVRDAAVVLERARLGVAAERGALKVQLTLQDARAWGSPPPTALLGAGAGGTEAASLGTHEAYVEARTSAARPAYVRVGRQAITWGDGRLLGEADWSPRGRALDAVRGHFAAGAWDFEALAAIVDTAHPIGAAAGETVGPTTLGSQLYGAQAAWSLDPLLKIELSALARVTREAVPFDGTRFSVARASGEAYVGSLRASGDSRGWTWAAEGAYELGRAALLADAPIAAWGAAGYVEKKLDTIALSPSLRLGAAYASGDDRGGTYRQLDPLLPDVHAHGAMDLFAWSNTIQGSARVGVVPWTDGRIAVEYRYARLAEASGEWIDAYLLGVGRGGASAELGHEIDVAWGWRPWPALDLAAGYSLLVLGDGARASMAAQSRGEAQADGTIAPPSWSHFAYLQATVAVP